MTSPAEPERHDRRTRPGARLELQLSLLLALVPIGLALLPDQTAVSRASWVLLSLTLATAFGAIGERRRQRRMVMRNAFALSIIAFGVLAGLMIRESGGVTFAALEPSTSSPERALPSVVPTAPLSAESQVQGATATAEDALAECHAALRAAERAISPVTTGAAPTTTAAGPERRVADRRIECEAIVAFLDAAIRETGALQP